ncbi:MAG: endopeptidase La [Gammaproteobacteria bacterium]|nr:endopeptidase La [Gammaproteobacteria bacterium]
MTNNKKKEITDIDNKDHLIPLLSLRDVAIYPHMVIPLFVGRKQSIASLFYAMESGKQIFLIAQKNPEQEDPKEKDLYRVGTVANVLQLLKLPDGTVKILVEGIKRGRMIKIVQDGDVSKGEIEDLKESWRPTKEAEAVVRALLDSFTDYVKINSKIPSEIMAALSDITDVGRLADTIAMHLPLNTEDRQKILEAMNIKVRSELVLQFLEAEIDLLHIEEKIQDRVKSQVEKGQREYYLREKLNAIRKELGEAGEAEEFIDDVDKLEKEVKKKKMSKEAEEKALSEVKKLRMIPAMSPETTVIRNYVNWLVDIPWQEQSKVNKNLKKAETILDHDHYGLEKIKERIVEYLAVGQRVDKSKGPILCFVGPPGVGKTSLGQSIARATGREFIRVALGGVRDEAEIRGHRRTYIGSLPGKVIQKMAKVKVKNPLFMLDEVDKMSMDFRGDPSSALLEVLDPEQNHAFSDHYLEIDYDLSDVMFICTANTLDIPAPLLDRMELLMLEGYTEDEKINIAMRYLIPKQFKENGVKETELEIKESAVTDIIRYYTREAGVRALERSIAKICRKVIKNILTERKKGKKGYKKVTVTNKQLEKYLGVQPFDFGKAEEHDQVGQVTGLAWTEVGGDLLTIEVAIVPGKGNATYTGSLGEVMLESIQAAITVVRSRAAKLGIDNEIFSNSDIHVHVPEGATPKDGPSAGISMCVALVSALTGIPVKATVAMTGEITLRGEIMAIGGLKEKLLAALRGGIKTVLIPKENEKYLKELPKNITQKLEIKPMQWIDEVLEAALIKMPQPLKKTKAKAKEKAKTKPKAKK